MRRSRSLSFKKEQEQKLKSIISPPVRKEELKQTPIKRIEREVPKQKAYPYSDSDDDDIPLSKITKSKVNYSDDEEEVKEEPPKRQSVKKQQEEEDDQEEEEEEELEEVSPPPKKGRPKSAKPLEKEVKPAQKKSPPKKQKVEEVKQKAIKDEEEEEDDKKRKLIISKSLFSKLISESNIDSTSSDIYSNLQNEMVDYVVEVIKIISNNETDDEIVVKDSNLKFLGNKDKSLGILDIKTFEKIYSEAQKVISHNVTFTSESYKSLCKYTEIHILEFLKKAKTIMAHSGRKRLTLADIELLKYILE